MFQACASLTNVTIPDSVTSIGWEAFESCTSLSSVALPRHITAIDERTFAGCTSLASVAIPRGVTNLGALAFSGCTSLTNLAIPDSVTHIGPRVFSGCTNLTSITISNGLRSVGEAAFMACTGLTSLTLPPTVMSVGAWGFYGCANLHGVYFEGDAPIPGLDVLSGANQATVYYLPGTTGWDSTFGGRPTAPWALPYPMILSASPSFGVQTNAFGFIISWATNASVVVETCGDPACPTWSPMGTNVLNEGWWYLSDPLWTHSASRFYRIRLL
jgi:hypothetical protein